MMIKRPTVQKKHERVLLARRREDVRQHSAYLLLFINVSRPPVTLLKQITIDVRKESASAVILPGINDEKKVPEMHETNKTGSMEVVLMTISV